MKYLFAFFVSLLPAMAYGQSTDRYWAQLMGAREAQSAAQLVQLAKQVDDLQAKLDAAKKACPMKPGDKPDAQQKP